MDLPGKEEPEKSCDRVRLHEMIHERDRDLQLAAEIGQTLVEELSEAKERMHADATAWEEERQESAVVYEGIYEMMSRLHFVSWMGKPKNGSM